MRGGKTGILMLHGYLGSPASTRPMARYMHDRGLTMHCPLLPGHGHLPSRMQGVSRKDWIASAGKALHELRAMCDEVFIMGHSMGTVLAAHLLRRHRDIRGFVLLAPLYEVPDKRLYLMAGLRYVMPWFYPLKLMKSRSDTVFERIHDFDPTIDLDDPEVQAALPTITRVPTSSLDEMRKMAGYGRRIWSKVKVPSLILQGDHDTAVDPAKAQIIHDRLGSKDKALRYFKGAGHELMRPFEPAHKEVWPAVYDFVRERSDKLTAA